MGTRSGLITRKSRMPISSIMGPPLVFLAALGLVAGLQNASSQTPATPAPDSRSPSPAAKAGMVKIAEGRFIMGDKSQPDAKPHEVAVSSFYIDSHLVTQELYQKA